VSNGKKYEKRENATDFILNFKAIAHVAGVEEPVQYVFGAYNKKTKKYYDRVGNTNEFNEIPKRKDGIPLINFNMTIMINKMKASLKSKDNLNLDKPLSKFFIKEKNTILGKYDKKQCTCPVCGKQFYIILKGKYFEISGNERQKEKPLIKSFYIIKFRKRNLIFSCLSNKNNDVIQSFIELPDGDRLRRYKEFIIPRGSTISNEYKGLRITLYHNQKICPDCKNKNRKMTIPKTDREVRKCEWCGKPLEGMRIDAKTHKGSCRQALYRSRKK
jgi:hypothetical protein